MTMLMERSDQVALVARTLNAFNKNRKMNKLDPEERRPLRPNAAWLIMAILIVVAVIMILRNNDAIDDKREPSPTPTNENVHEIAP